MFARPSLDPVAQVPLYSVEAGLCFTTSRFNLALVIPCYNEEARLDVSAIESFLAEQPGTMVIFVNDGSRDGTGEVIKKIRCNNPLQVVVMTLHENQGKAEAVRAGMIHAMGFDVAYIGYWDADLATPLHIAPDLTSLLDRYRHIDVIFGSRRPMLGHLVNRTPGRRLLGRINAKLAAICLDMPIGDTQCGAKLFRRSASLGQALTCSFASRWIFDLELFGRLKKLKSDTGFYEYPLPEWTEVAGSKVKPRDVVDAGFNMLKMIALFRLGLGQGPRRACVVASAVRSFSMVQPRQTTR